MSLLWFGNVDKGGPERLVGGDQSGKVGISRGHASGRLWSLKNNTGSGETNGTSWYRNTVGLQHVGERLVQSEWQCCTHCS